MNCINVTDGTAVIRFLVIPDSRVIVSSQFLLALIFILRNNAAPLPKPQRQFSMG
jgi:hypothetical protein